VCVAWAFRGHVDRETCVECCWWWCRFPTLYVARYVSLAIKKEKGKSREAGSLFFFFFEAEFLEASQLVVECTRACVCVCVVPSFLFSAKSPFQP
jgi:hypothetical protein